MHMVEIPDTEVSVFQWEASPLFALSAGEWPAVPPRQGMHAAKGKWQFRQFVTFADLKLITKNPQTAEEAIVNGRIHLVDSNLTDYWRGRYQLVIGS
jgi:hypothetical protein